jgi:drug/metabolite transporter (DMT)-like permease
MLRTMHTPAPTLTPTQGRLCVVAAAVLWSTSGAFTKVLTQPTPLGLEEPPIEPLRLGGIDFAVQLACYRALFASLALAPTLRARDFGFRPLMLVMGVSFATMNICFVSATALGTAANAILLQYTAPLWMYLVSVFCLGEVPDRRGTVALFLGVFGIGVIVAGGWQEGELVVIAIALGSGLTYAGVILCLRVLRGLSSRWLTVWNHGVAALVLVPLLVTLRPPTPGQYVVLFFFGFLQMGLAYWLMARALHVVGAAEAGTICLLEPLLNPLWAYLTSGETPSGWTLLGGAIVLAALAWRYCPSPRINVTETRG